MFIEISTHDRHAVFSLLGKDQATAGETIRLADGVDATLHPGMAYKSLGLPEVTGFAVAVVQSMPASVVADIIWNWLSTRLKTRPVTTTIDRLEVEFEEGAVKRLIVERMTKSE